jgi:hypothetical protein
MNVLRHIFIAAATTGMVLAWYRVVFPAFENYPFEALTLTLLLMFGCVSWLQAGQK